MIKKIPISPKKEQSKKTAEEWISSREGIQRFTFDMPLPLHDKLKITAIKQRQTMGEIIKICLEDYLNTL